MTAPAVASGCGGCGRGVTRLLAIVVGAALLMAACSDGSTDAPHVASLGGDVSGSSARSGDHSGNSAAAVSKDDANQLLDEWAACMRRHGDPGQADPTVDLDKVIHIIMAPWVPGGFTGTDGQNGSGGPGSRCLTYLNDASNLLRGNQPLPRVPSPPQLVKFGNCMRANGVPGFPEGPAGASPGGGPMGRPASVLNNRISRAPASCAARRPA